MTVRLASRRHAVGGRGSLGRSASIVVLRLWMLALAVAAPVIVDATAFLAKDEALALAFPGTERIEDRVVILTDAQKAEVERLARATLESQLWTIYVGWKGSEVLGYAVIDSHMVRTLPETFMVVIEPERRGPPRRGARLPRAAASICPTERWIGAVPRPCARRRPEARRRHPGHHGRDIERAGDDGGRPARARSVAGRRGAIGGLRGEPVQPVTP